MSNAKPIENILFRLRHTMLPVKDLERSIDFYTRLLGMEVMRRRINEANTLSVGYVGYGNEDHYPVLELVEDIGLNLPAKMNHWEGHISIQVSDLYNLCESLEKEGVKFIRPAGPNRPGRKDLVACIADPDDYKIELNERYNRTAFDK
ncbi:VOC family protein [Thermodesulfobacteriota bacterium]